MWGEPGQTVSPVTPYLHRALPSSPTRKVLMYLFWETGEGARLVLAARGGKAAAGRRSSSRHSGRARPKIHLGGVLGGAGELLWTA